MIFQIKYYIQCRLFLKIQKPKIKSKLFTNCLNVRCDIGSHLVRRLGYAIYNYSNSIIWEIKRSPAHGACWITPA